MNDALRRLDVAEEDEAAADLDRTSCAAAVDAAKDFVGLHRAHIPGTSGQSGMAVHAKKISTRATMIARE